MKGREDIVGKIDMLNCILVQFKRKKEKEYEKSLE